MKAFIKKNRWLVAGGAVALVLLVVAGVFLFLSIQQYISDTREAEEGQKSLVQLINNRPGPTPNNVKIVASNAALEEAFLNKVIATLQQGQVKPRSDMQRVVFNAFLKTTIDQMNEAAKKNGLLIPPKFDYGFKTYYTEGNLPVANDIPRLTVQVQMVKAIMDLLLLSRVSEVVAIERQVFEGDTATMGTTPVPGTASERRYTRNEAPTLTTTTASLSPDAQGLYTREHFSLTLGTRDKMLTSLLNALGGTDATNHPRLFAVVTRLEITGVGLPKMGSASGADDETHAPEQSGRTPTPGVETAPSGEGTTTSGEKPALPKKREERVVAGTDNVTVQLDVDICRFAAATQKKAKQ